jgi:hypothetical protein
VNIECAFGELVGRWGILWRPLKYSVDKSKVIVFVLCKLHNVCIDNRFERTASVDFGHSDDMTPHDGEWPDFSVHLQGDYWTEPARALVSRSGKSNPIAATVRDDKCERLQLAGFCRVVGESRRAALNSECE